MMSMDEMMEFLSNAENDDDILENGEQVLFETLQEYLDDESPDPYKMIGEKGSLDEGRMGEFLNNTYEPKEVANLIVDCLTSNDGLVTPSNSYIMIDDWNAAVFGFDCVADAIQHEMSEPRSTLLEFLEEKFAPQIEYWKKEYMEEE